MPHFMIVLILYINLLKSVMDKKCLFFRDMEPLRMFVNAATEISDQFREEDIFTPY